MRPQRTGTINITAGLIKDERGITGLETAIVLIAFVVVAAVFAFAILSTGLLSSEKSKETVLGGLEETSSTISLRGGVIADANSAKTAIDSIKFTLTSAAQSSESVDLSTGGVTVTYLDEDTGINCDNPSVGGTDTCDWTASWLVGTSDLLDPGEQVEITVTITNVTPKLGKKMEFTIQVKPNIGAVVIVNTTLPGEIKGVMDLK